MKTIIILFFILSSFIFKAQIISLEQAASYPKQSDGRSLPEGITYIKDINNSLDIYVGTWKGSYNGKNYEFRFIKKLAVGDRIKRDKIIGRLLITDNSGNIIYSSLDKPDDNTLLSGLNFVTSNVKMYSLNYAVNGDCNDYGTLFLASKTSNQNELSLTFWREPDLVNLTKCPQIKTYVTLIPLDTSIKLIKQ